MDRGKGIGIMNNSDVSKDLKNVIKENVLHLLPAKSLVRFKLVCKDWNDYISGQSFAWKQSFGCRVLHDLYIQREGSPPVYLSLDSKSSGVPVPDLRFLLRPVVVKSSSNGLLLCYSGVGFFYVCNPVTKQWRSIPCPTVMHGFEPEAVLILDPRDGKLEFNIVCAFSSEDETNFLVYHQIEGQEDTWDTLTTPGAKKIVPLSGVQVYDTVFWKLEIGDVLEFDFLRRTTRIVPCLSYGVLRRIGRDLWDYYMEENSIMLIQLGNVDGDIPEMWRVILDYDISNHPFALTTYMIDCRAVYVQDNDTLVMQNQERLLYSYNMATNEFKQLVLAAELTDDVRWVPYLNTFLWFFP